MTLLAGYRVLDLTDEQGLLTGRMLADLGADVVQVEPPGGSPARKVPPLAQTAGGERSMYWEAFAANKRGLVCDLETGSGREVLRVLASQADFFVTSLDPGFLVEAGLDWPALAQLNPGLVYVQITPFGPTGPKAGYVSSDLIVWAASGALHPNRHGTRPPVRISSQQSFLHAGADAAVAALIAHRYRQRTGVGQLVDISAQVSSGLATICRVLAHAVHDDAPGWQFEQKAVDLSGSGSATPPEEKKWPCRDGYIEMNLGVGPTAGTFTNQLSAWMRSEGALDDDLASVDWRLTPELSDPGAADGGADDGLDGAAARQVTARFRQAVGAFFATRTKEEANEASLKQRIGCSGIRHAGDVAAAPQFAARRFWAELGDEGSRQTLPGPFAVTSVEEAFDLRYPAPAPGQHTEEVLADWSAPRPRRVAPAARAEARRAMEASADPEPGAGTGSGPSTGTGSGGRTGPSAETGSGRRTGPGSGDRTGPSAETVSGGRAGPVREEEAAGADQPLAGLRVLDFSWVFAGPMVGRTLADFGATVVRTESGTRLDPARRMKPYLDGEAGVERSSVFGNCNAGKLGITLDFTQEEARQVASDLAQWADVVVESYSPGVMARWGLDFPTLSAGRPDLIMVSSCLNGQTGPMAGLAGFGNVGAALSGFAHLGGWVDAPPIGPFGPYTDYLGPRFALAALLAALDHRDRTGEGCYIDVSQIECGVYFLSPEMADYFATGRVAERDGNADPRYAPHGVYPCLTEEGRDRFIAIAVTDDEQWGALSALMGCPELGDDPRFATAPARRRAREELDGLVAAWCRSAAVLDVEKLLQSHGVPAHRSATSQDFVEDPQLAHRGHLVTLPHPTLGETVVEGPRYRLSATPGRVRRAAPTLGEDNDYVLRELLGYPEARVAALRQSAAMR